MALFRYGRDMDSVNSLFRLQEELQRVFESPNGLGLGLLGRGAHPPVNIFRADDDVVIRMEVPGFAPDALSIESLGQTLTVTGKPPAETGAQGGYHRRERAASEFSRSIQLPREVDAGKATAQYKHGVLTVRVPAREEAKARQITVQSA
jgi:HSP20 family protein